MVCSEYPPTGRNLVPTRPSVNSAVVCIGHGVRYHACMPSTDAAAVVKRLAGEAGFDRCGIARAEAIGRAEYLRAWLAAGRAGSMAYLHRYMDKRTDPRELLEGARSVIVVALLYHQPAPHPTQDDPTRSGRVAMYAWGDDYHALMWGRLDQLAMDSATP